MSDPDIRGGELKEGAGLDESRLNTEFIELLQKWSSPVLFGVAGIVIAYWGYGQLQKRQNDQLNEAYQQYTEIASSANPSPTSLRIVAKEYGDKRFIGLQARLREADVYLDSVRTGLVPGAQPVGFGQDTPEEDLLTDEDRATYLDDSERLYQQVMDEAGATPGQQVHALGAAFGMAAVAEERGDAEQARAAYERVKEMAERVGFSEFVSAADTRLESMDLALSRPTLPSIGDLPRPEPEITIEPGEPVVEDPSSMDSLSEDPGVIGPLPEEVDEPSDDEATESDPVETDAPSDG